VLQLEQLNDVEEIQTALIPMDWLDLAGVSRRIRKLSDRDLLTSYASHWLCVGRARAALER